jgi:hypothetical protein
MRVLHRISQAVEFGQALSEQPVSSDLIPVLQKSSGQFAHNLLEFAAFLIDQKG